MINELNAYQILGLTTDATESEIRQRGKELAHKARVGSRVVFEIDKISTNPIERTAELVQSAIQKLEDPTKRILEEITWVSDRIKSLIPSITGTYVLHEIFAKLSKTESLDVDHDLFVIGRLILSSQMYSKHEIPSILKSLDTICNRYGSDYFDELLEKYSSYSRVTDEYVERVKEDIYLDTIERFERLFQRQLEKKDFEQVLVITEGFGEAEIDLSLRDDLTLRLSTLLSDTIFSEGGLIIDQIKVFNDGKGNRGIKEVCIGIQDALAYYGDLVVQTDVPTGINCKRQVSICYNNLAFVYANEVEDFTTALDLIRKAVLVYPEITLDEKQILVDAEELFLDLSKTQINTLRPPSMSVAKPERDRIIGNIGKNDSFVLILFGLGLVCLIYILIADKPNVEALVVLIIGFGLVLKLYLYIKNV